MHDVTTVDFARIAQDLQIRKVQVESVVQLLDEGNTVPFITRYRKERTGGLNEEIIRQVQARALKQRQLLERKQTILKSIENQGKLTDDLRQAIQSAETSKRLEDLYLPYKPKKRTQATIARERGLEPLAQAIWNRDPAVANLNEVLPTLVNPEKELASPADILTGVQHVLAEQMADTAEVRHAVRCVLWETGKLTARKRENLADGQGLDFKDYFQFTEPVRHIPAHRILALNRGEKEGPIQVKIEWDAQAGHQAARSKLPLADHPHAEFLKTVAEDAVNRLIVPSLEREIRRELSEEAETHAVKVFARNLHSLLMQPPLRGKRVLAIDPGFRTGCKIAALDEHGNLLEEGVLFPHPPPSKPPKKKKEGSAEPAGTSPASPAPPSRDGGVQQDNRATQADHAASLLAPQPSSEAAQTTGAPTHAADVSAVASTSEPHPSQTLSIETSVSADSENPALRIDNEESKVGNSNPVQADYVSSAAGSPSTVLTASVESPMTPAAAATAMPVSSPAPIEQPSAEKKEKPATTLKRQEAKARLETLIRKHQTQVIAIGNGTACRETEEFVADVIASLEKRKTEGTDGGATPVGAPPEPAEGKIPGQGFEKLATGEAAPSSIPDSEPSSADLPESPADLAYVIVNEAGASVYSASAVGREEFPAYDATLRGTISIGRRLQDPLSELVKIDPQSVGVGLYQHDVNPRYLKETLEAVIESSVNEVGVDLNTASVPLLRHVSGLNQLVARDIVDYRKKNGPFKNREQLLQVPNLGPARFIQAAGFLRIANGDNPLDQTSVHPESYPAANRLLAELGYAPDALTDKQKIEGVREKLKSLSPEEVCKRLEVGLPTLRDILGALSRPGRDPRDDLPPPIFKKGILKLEDLQAGMELKGTVLNVVDFGAFIDIGLKDSGLVHISQMANRYIKSPYEIVSVSDVVTVWVLSVDRERRRVSLTMIKPGTQRKPPQKKPEQRHEQPGAPTSGRPPRGRRHGPPKKPAPSLAVAKPSSVSTSQVAVPSPAAVAGPGPSPPTPSTSPPPRPAAPPPPRKPQRRVHRPKLTQEALQGETPLRTFSELMAFFEAKREEEKPAASESTPETRT
jgi:uncharacterized protein